MRNRTITYVLLSLILLLFTVYFITQNIVFKSGRLIEDKLNEIIQYVQQNKWSEAEEAVNKLVYIWDKNKYLLSLNYAEADHSLFIDNFSRMQGAIKTKDDTETISLALSTLALWNNFIKVVPEP